MVGADFFQQALVYIWGNPSHPWFKSVCRVKLLWRSAVPSPPVRAPSSPPQAQTQKNARGRNPGRLSKRILTWRLATTEIASAASTSSSATTTATAAVIAEVTARSVETSSAATATWRTILTGTSFVDREGTTIEFFSVKCLDGGLCFRIRAHRHEGEAARATGEFILHQHDFRNGAALGEQVLNGDLRRVEREISDIEFCAHGIVFLRTGIGDCSRLPGFKPP